MFRLIAIANRHSPSRRAPSPLLNLVCFSCTTVQSTPERPSARTQKPPPQADCRRAHPRAKWWSFGAIARRQLLSAGARASRDQRAAGTSCQSAVGRKLRVGGGDKRKLPLVTKPPGCAARAGRLSSIFGPESLVNKQMFALRYEIRRARERVMSEPQARQLAPCSPRQAPRRATY